MGRKAYCTKEEVFAAADEIAANGADVTVRHLHTFLGGGSYTSILRHLADWKRERTEPAAQNTGVPEEVSTVAQRVCVQIWELAFRQATENLEAQRAQIEEEVMAARLHAEEAIGHAEDLANKLEEQKLAQDELKQKIATIEGDLSKSENRNATLTGSNKELTKQVENLSRAIESLEYKLEVLKDNHEKTLTLKEKEHEDEIARLTANTSKIETERVKLEAERDAARVELQASQARIIAASDEARALAEKLETKLEAARKEKEGALTQVAELRGRISILEEREKEPRSGKKS